jgi:hypothetical protein
MANPSVQQILANHSLTILGRNFNYLGEAQLKSFKIGRNATNVQKSLMPDFEKLPTFLDGLQPLLDEYKAQLGKKPVESLPAFLKEKYRLAIYNLLRGNQISISDAKAFAKKECKNLIKALDQLAAMGLPKYCEEQDNYYSWLMALELYKDLKDRNIVQQALTIQPLTLFGLDVSHPTQDELKLYKKICQKWAKLDEKDLEKIDPNEREIFNKIDHKIRALFTILENLVSKVYCEERRDEESGQIVTVPAVGFDSNDIPDLLAESYQKAIEQALQAQKLDIHEYRQLIEQECSIPQQAIAMFLSLSNWPRTYDREDKSFDLLVKNLALFDRKALKNKVETNYFQDNPRALIELKDLIHDFDWDRLIDQHDYMKVLDKLHPYLANTPPLVQPGVAGEERVLSRALFEQENPEFANSHASSVSVPQTPEKAKIQDTSFNEYQYEEEIVRPLFNLDAVQFEEETIIAQSERLNALPQILKPETSLERQAKSYFTHHIERNKDHFHVLIHDACLMMSINEAKTISEQKKNANKKSAIDFIFNNKTLLRQLWNISGSNLAANLADSLLFRALALYDGAYQIPEGGVNPFEDNFSAYASEHTSEQYVKVDQTYSARSFIGTDASKLEVIAKHALAKEMLKPFSRKLCYQHISYAPSEVRHDKKATATYLQAILHLARYDEDIILDLLDRRFAFPLFTSHVSAYLNNSNIIQLLQFGSKKNEEGRVEFNPAHIHLVFGRRFFKLVQPDAKNFSGQELIQLLTTADSGALRNYIIADKDYLKAINNHLKKLSKPERAKILYQIRSTQANQEIVKDLKAASENQEGLECLSESCSSCLATIKAGQNAISAFSTSTISEEGMRALDSLLAIYPEAGLLAKVVQLKGHDEGKKVIKALHAASDKNKFKHVHDSCSQEIIRMEGEEIVALLMANDEKAINTIKNDLKPAFKKLRDYLGGLTNSKKIEVLTQIYFALLHFQNEANLEDKFKIVFAAVKEHKIIIKELLMLSQAALSDAFNQALNDLHNSCSHLIIRAEGEELVEALATAHPDTINAIVKDFPNQLETLNNYIDTCYPRDLRNPDRRIETLGQIITSLQQKASDARSHLAGGDLSFQNDLGTLIREFTQALKVRQNPSSSNSYTTPLRNNTSSRIQSPLRDSAQSKQAKRRSMGSPYVAKSTQFSLTPKQGLTLAAVIGQDLTPGAKGHTPHSVKADLQTEDELLASLVTTASVSGEADKPSEQEALDLSLSSEAGPQSEEQLLASLAVPVLDGETDKPSEQEALDLSLSSEAGPQSEEQLLASLAVPVLGGETDKPSEQEALDLSLSSEAGPQSEEQLLASLAVPVLGGETDKPSEQEALDLSLSSEAGPQSEEQLLASLAVPVLGGETDKPSEQEALDLPVSPKAGPQTEHDGLTSSDSSKASVPPEEKQDLVPTPTKPNLVPEAPPMTPADKNKELLKGLLNSRRANIESPDKLPINPPKAPLSAPTHLPEPGPQLDDSAKTAKAGVLGAISQVGDLKAFFKQNKPALYRKPPKPASSSKAEEKELNSDSLPKADTSSTAGPTTALYRSGGLSRGVPTYPVGQSDTGQPSRIGLFGSSMAIDPSRLAQHTRRDSLESNATGWTEVGPKVTKATAKKSASKSIKPTRQ